MISALDMAGPIRAVPLLAFGLLRRLPRFGAPGLLVCPRRRLLGALGLSSGACFGQHITGQIWWCWQTCLLARLERGAASLAKASRSTT